MNVRQLLTTQVKKYPAKPAIIYKEQVITFGDLADQVFKLASALSRLGVKKSNKVAILLPNCPEYVDSYLACFCLGAVVVPLDFMLKDDEITSCLNHAEVRFLIVHNKPDISLATILAQSPTVEKVIFVGEMPADKKQNYFAWGELLAGAKTDLPEVAIADLDPALIMYTSGTTGRPKGILLNYRHLDGSPTAMDHFVDLSDKDVKICPIPLSHIGGFIYIQNCLLFGITVILMDRFNPFEFLRLIEQHKVTCFHTVPAMYTAMLAMKQIEKMDLSSLRWVVVFGAPSSPDIMARFHRYCPNAQLLNGWGMTETCPPNVVTPFGSANIASVGKPSPHCEIRIVDDNGQPLASGEIGEITIRGWTNMVGYYKDTEATAAVLRDGWLYTGDLGRFDQEGFLYIVGRKKEMIKVGGQIVYAPEVEAAFYKHEAVAEVAVIGVSDPLRGEAVKAFIVLKEGASVSAEDLRYFARNHLAHFKVPHVIDICAHLPKNRTGKIDKEALQTSNGSSDTAGKNNERVVMATMKKEVHLNGMDLMNMVQLRPSDIGKYAIVPGPRERMEAVIKKLDKPIKNFSFMEYTMYTGTYEGIKITSINGGRFAADTGITTEILCCAQAKTMIRIGSCGALREDIKVGDFIVAQNALCGEGVTPYYVDKDYEPQADAKLTQMFAKQVKAAGQNVHVGKVWSTDAILRETREHVGAAVKKGAIAVDMVTSAFLTICAMHKIPAAVVLAVSDNVITGEMGFMNPAYYMAETAMIDMAFGVVKNLEKG